MTANQYSEVSKDIIDQLKLNGFTNLNFALLDQRSPYQAMVEIIPGRDQDCMLDTVSLWTDEIDDFGDWASPMVKYVIDRKFIAFSTPKAGRRPCEEARRSNLC